MHHKISKHAWNWAKAIILNETEHVKRHVALYDEMGIVTSPFFANPFLYTSPLQKGDKINHLFKKYMACCNQTQ